MKRLLLCFALLAAAPVAFSDSNVYVQSVQKPIGPVFAHVVAALKHSGFKVVNKIDIGKKLGGAARHFHWKDYNQNHLKGIRTVIFCNAKFANAIGNADPEMLAVCPLHVTLFQQGDITRIEFVKPAVIAQGTKAEGPATKLQDKIIVALKKAVAAK